MFPPAPLDTIGTPIRLLVHSAMELEADLL